MRRPYLKPKTLVVARTDLAELLRDALPGRGVPLMWAIDRLIQAHTKSLPTPAPRKRGKKR